MYAKTRQARDQISDLVKDSGPWFHAKVWLNIHVTLPHRKIDPINVIDVVADGVKLGINIDDNWFAIEKLDWSMGQEGLVDIEIWQEADQDYRVCTDCKEIRPLTEFTVNKRGPLGRAYLCKFCRRERYSKRSGN